MQQYSQWNDTRN